MPTIDEYCDLARNRQGFDSDRQLGNALGKKGSAVSTWRQKKSWPADDTMIGLADLAGVDPEQALLDLNAWRAPSQVRKVYESLASKLAMLGLAAFLILPGTFAQHSNMALDHALYYGKLLCLKLYQTLSRILWRFVAECKITCKRWNACAWGHPTRANSGPFVAPFSRLFNFRYMLVNRACRLSLITC